MPWKLTKCSRTWERVEVGAGSRGYVLHARGSVDSVGMPCRGLVCWDLGGAPPVNATWCSWWFTELGGPWAGLAAGLSLLVLDFSGQGWGGCSVCRLYCRNQVV